MTKSTIIGLSGGVDSSTAAYLLKKEGYSVVGLNIDFWVNMKDTSSKKDAREVAKKLNIPLHTINVKEQFQKNVIEYFVKEYKEGKTPNPCVICNRCVKFQTLLDSCKTSNTQYIATGHYANIEKKNNRYLLKKGKDKTKDQSYMLYNLTQEQLSKLLLPLGKYTKEEVRDIAKKAGLLTAHKKDSQEICFINDNDHHRFITEYSKEKPIQGNFVDREGNILGKHKGISKYTIGQRKGIGISANKPIFVTDINPAKNEITLGDEKELFKKEIYVKDLNWIAFEKLEQEIIVNAKIRYAAREERAKLIPLAEGKIKAVFEKAQRAPTPGQAIVFYSKEYVLGGGIIESAT